MDQVDKGPDLNIELDIFGQRPGFDKYIQICLCYNTISLNGVSDQTVIDTLTKGIERLSVGYPWMTGRVVNEGSRPGNSGVYKIKALGSTPQIHIKEFNNEKFALGMHALRELKFPFSILDENVFAPYNNNPRSSTQLNGRPKPVFAIQANFLYNGLLLTFVGHHQAMDMTGLGQMIRLLSKACRGEHFTSDELTTGNLPRRDLIPFLQNEHNVEATLCQQTVRPQPPLPVSNSTKNQLPPPPTPTCSWAYAIFPRSSHMAVKSEANQSLSDDASYVSTDDALTAFIWQCVARARLPRLGRETKTTIARAIDARRHLNLPDTYPGVVQNMSFTTAALGELAEARLNMYASTMRRKIDPHASNFGHTTKSFATALHHATDKGSVSPEAHLNGSTDVVMSSWTKLDSYELDFNLGFDKPIAVRRPRMLPMEGMMFLMPKTLDGDIALGLCLRDEDLERLRADERFMHHVTHVG